MVNTANDEPQRSTCLNVFGYGSRRGSFTLFMEDDDDNSSVTIYENYNELGIRSSMITATVPVFGLVTLSELNR